MAFKDYYAVLGVRPEAPLAEIKAAFKKLALKLHPDKQQPVQSSSSFLLSINGYNAERMHSFNDVQEAYATLSDDFKRMMHDSERQAMMGHSGTPTPAGNFRPPVSMGLPPRGASALATAALKFAEKQQFFDESNTRWESLFQERSGHIERRPASRQQRSREGTRGASSCGNANVGSEGNDCSEEMFPPPPSHSRAASATAGWYQRTEDEIGTRRPDEVPMRRCASSLDATDGSRPATREAPLPMSHHGVASHPPLSIHPKRTVTPAAKSRGSPATDHHTSSRPPLTAVGVGVSQRQDQRPVLHSNLPLPQQDDESLNTFPQFKPKPNVRLSQVSRRASPKRKHLEALPMDSPQKITKEQRVQARASARTLAIFFS